jgi:predicted site-specific integrase-resolvase
MLHFIVKGFMGLMLKISDFFYTEAEVARIFNVNRVTVWRWIRAGKFDSQKIGHEVIIPKWQVELMRIESENVKV